MYSKDELKNLKLEFWESFAASMRQERVRLSSSK